MVATRKVSLAEVSLSQITVLTGKTYRTVKRRLDGLEPVRTDGKTFYYDPKVALPRVYFGTEGNSLEELTVQRARLAREQADSQELKNEQLRGELLPAEDNEKTLIALASGVQLRLLALPTKAAPLAYAAESTQEAEAILKRYVEEALSEIAEAAPAVVG